MLNKILGAALVIIVLFLIFSTDKSKTRIDKIAGGSLVRSLQISDYQVMAREILEQSAENRNLMCLGSTPAARKAKLAKLLQDVDSGKTVDTACLDRVYQGRASTTKIIRDGITSFTDNFTKTVFEGPIFPQLGGAYVAKIEAGYKYTVEVTGRREQIEYINNEQFHHVIITPSGKLPKQGYKTITSSDPNYQRMLIGKNQPVGMAVLTLGNKYFFVHHGKAIFTARQDAVLKLTVNCKQTPQYFKNSRGNWHVAVTRVKA